MTNTAIPTYHKGQRNFGTGYDMMARIAELEAERDALAAAKWAVQHTDTMNDMVQMGMARDEAEARAQRAEAALDEIIMEATSRNHAIDIARRARQGGDT